MLFLLKVVTSAEKLVAGFFYVFQLIRHCVLDFQFCPERTESFPKARH